MTRENPDKNWKLRSAKSLPHAGVGLEQVDAKYSHLLSRRCLAASVMVDYIKHHESDWLVSYEQKYGPRTTLNLMHLCRRFAARHGFVRKCATTSKMSADDLMRQVRQNAQAFWEKYFGKDASLVLNCDELASAMTCLLERSLL
ncbi:hypothetical protein ACHHYP_20743 [Achlya hypogyna]|uniref:Uncharacterized protein n=1 Tax=Achlya hypogyna TaxID=1202772 RepID=A0A1V9YCE5_ACHHY|nr:hypothetical protein ACHHYP_20743 [Achlya hypogyna]